MTEQSAGSPSIPAPDPEAMRGHGGGFDLLATKLRRPAALSRRVARPRLVARLDAGLVGGRQVTLVSAPAGFGKSTVVAEWVGGFPGPVAWLSLDLADDDPARFAAYLVAALQRVDGRVGRGIEGALRAGHMPAAGTLAAALIADLLEVDGRFLLVLDDVHVIQDPANHQVLAQLVAHPPPALHLVLVTREDPPLPLARLRAHNRLTEVRAKDLRFTADETHTLLNDVMGLALSGADLAVLDARIEGWIAALQLVALALRETGRGGDGAPLLEGLRGSRRFMLGYLAEEVLSRQPDDVVDFMLQTSLLDRLCPDLCNAVTGRTDGRALLGALVRDNLFLIPLDDEQRWYRYHHLFADLLRSRLMALDPGRAQVLHGRAGRWLAAAGMVPDAVAHTLAAREYQAALDLVERHALELVLQGRIKTVEGWMLAIPPEWQARSVRANMAFAWMHFLRQAPSRALAYVERVRGFLPAAGGSHDPTLEAEWFALQAAAHNAGGQPADGLALARRALEIVPEGDHLVACLIYLAVARAAQQLNDSDGAADAFGHVAEHGRLAANPVIELLGLAGLSALAIQRGQLGLAFDLSSRAVDLVERSRVVPPISATVYGALGQVCYDWNRLDEAHAYWRRAVEVSTLSGYGDVEISYQVLLSRMAEIAGDLDTATSKIEGCATMLQGGAPTWLRAEVAAQQVRVHLARADMAAAEAVLERAGFSADDEVTSQGDLFHLAHLRILCARCQRGGTRSGLGEVRAAARRIVRDAQAGGRSATILEASILLALAEWACGDVAGSLQTLDRALELAEPEGYQHIFYDEGAPMAALLYHARQHASHSAYLEGLLALFAASEKEVSPDVALQGGVLAEPLSERELEVLRLIQAGCSNREIAGRLTITLHTVKKHASNIYGKLGVNSRTRAVARARSLGLLEPDTTFE